MDFFIQPLAAVAAAAVPQVNGFQPHSVQLWQWQNILHYIVCYFATVTATQNGVGIQLIVAPLLQPHHVNEPLGENSMRSVYFGFIMVVYENFFSRAFDRKF